MITREIPSEAEQAVSHLRGSAATLQALSENPELEKHWQMILSSQAACVSRDADALYAVINKD